MLLKNNSTLSCTKGYYKTKNSTAIIKRGGVPGFQVQNKIEEKGSGSGECASFCKNESSILHCILTPTWVILLLLVRRTTSLHGAIRL